VKPQLAVGKAALSAFSIRDERPERVGLRSLPWTSIKCSDIRMDATRLRYVKPPVIVADASDYTEV
jgi:hypothetical protein